MLRHQIQYRSYCYIEAHGFVQDFNIDIERHKYLDQTDWIHS